MNNISYIICERTAYSPQSTLGRIKLTNNEYKNKPFCYSLEDTVRAKGIKVYSCTALPENLLGYKVKKTYSPRFKRFTLQLYTEDDLSINYDFGGDKNIKFDNVRVHGGNRHEDTEGCPLIAHNLIQGDRKKDFVIQGNAEVELMAWYDIEIEKGNEVRWVIINKPQES